jgi:hypothetical protein
MSVDPPLEETRNALSEFGTPETVDAYIAALSELQTIAQELRAANDSNRAGILTRLTAAEKNEKAAYDKILEADDKRIDNGEVGGSRRRRTRRRHTRRRRGGHSDLKTRKKGMVKALLKEARNQKERSAVMSRVHKQGMEMLARKAALRAKYSS